MVDLELFDRLKVIGEVELREDNYSVASPDSTMGNDDETVYVTERKQAHRNSGLNTKVFPWHRVEDTILHGVCDHISVRDHYGFLKKNCQEKGVPHELSKEKVQETYRQARGSARIAQECNLTRSLSLHPPQWLKRGH